jgi:hypothetical protein
MPAKQMSPFVDPQDFAMLGSDRSTEAIWVKLKASPSPYSYPEALLLCEIGHQEWIAWVPDFGEIRLTTAQFVIDSGS